MCVTWPNSVFENSTSVMPRRDGRLLVWKQVKAKTEWGQETDGRNVKGIGLFDWVGDGGEGNPPSFGLVKWVDDAGIWEKIKGQFLHFLGALMMSDCGHKEGQPAVSVAARGYSGTNLESEWFLLQSSTSQMEEWMWPTLAFPGGPSSLLGSPRWTFQYRHSRERSAGHWRGTPTFSLARAWLKRWACTEHLSALLSFPPCRHNLASHSGDQGCVLMFAFSS